ncbi:hypothetical protein IV102_22895 [bacterium]|nr:hypothetical protein [bacterium]
MPPPWVWAVFSLSILVLTASMMTWREGRRFQSRALLEAEQQVVQEAIDLLGSHDKGLNSHRVLLCMMQERRIRAMDRFTFARAEERNAFGYTDERGRILLNPNLCFSYQRLLAPRLLKGVARADLVATMATLHHEVGHLLGGASEATAYAAEWQLVCYMRRWCEATDRPELASELLDWEQHLPGRVRLHVGATAAEKMSRL